MKDNDIEDLFKQSFDNYEPEVKPKVWKNIRVGLKWGGLAFVINAFINKLGTATIITIVAVASTAIIGAITYFNWGNSDKQNKTAETKINAPIAETKIAEETSGTVAENIPSNEVVVTENNLSETALSTTPNTAKTIKEKKVSTIVENKSANESLASISASVITGTAPLIVDLLNSGTGKVNKWFFNDGKGIINSSNTTHIFEAPGSYTVLLSSKDASGKEDTDTLNIEVTGEMPSIKEFSPNGDGVTDLFILQSKNIASMNAKIYDQAALVVYKSEGTVTQWDGKNLKGEDAAAGTYFYSVQAQGVNGKKYDVKGAVKLKR